MADEHDDSVPMADEHDEEEPQAEADEARLDRLQAAIDELTTLLPRATGPTAGLPGRIADALAGIDERLAAVERMGREQFELDQRLTALDEAVAGLAAPFAELAPKLRHVDQLVDWLGRIEQRLHDAPVSSSEEGARDDTAVLQRLDRLVEQQEATAEQLGVVREALAAHVARAAETVDALARLEAAVAATASRQVQPSDDATTPGDDTRPHRFDDAVAELSRRMAAVQETASAVRAEHAGRLVDLQRLIERSRVTPPSADGFAAVADAVTRLERRVDAVAELLESLVSDDPRQRTADRVGERIERLRDVAGGVGDAIREELRRRRTGRPPEVGPG
ncbi:MAG TPA: hypothetical protein VHF47_07025 [Acidimicrobiales bacterium]|nr:hypothetical protein [Acidimicrobiales bacterium]